jgi:O-antigen ligase
MKVFLWIIGALLIAVPTVSLPDKGVWLGVKAFALEAVGIVLAVWVVSRGEWTRDRVRSALLAAPNVAILGFLIWIGVSAARSELPEMSRLEALRHLGGGLLYFAVVYGLSARRHLGQVVGFLLLAGSLAALLACLNFSQTDTHRVAGAFRNEQLLAGFLCLIAPIILMVSQKDDEPWRRTAGQAALVIVLGGILVARNRSGWLGTVVGLMVLGILYLRYGGIKKGTGFQKHQLIIPAVIVLLSIGLFLGMTQMSQLGGGIAGRASTISNLGHDVDFRWRIGMWDKAVRMVQSRPWSGWGVGTFPVQQALFFHPYCPNRQQRDIMRKGPTLSENAHNTYLQIAAELGYPGLALYLGIFGAFFFTAIRALRSLRPGFRQAVVMAAIAGAAAQMASAIGSPAWEFAECSLFLWLILGLGMATAGVGERGRARASRSEAPLESEEPVLGYAAR